MNKIVCTLDYPCPYKNENDCGYVDSKCCFKRMDKERTKYVRKERWYEKYYRERKRQHMFGIDWSGDGKVDLQEEMITLELLEEDEEEDEEWQVSSIVKQIDTLYNRVYYICGKDM